MIVRLYLFLVCLFSLQGGCSTGSTLLGYLFFDVGSMNL